MPLWFHTYVASREHLIVIFEIVRVTIDFGSITGFIENFYS